MFFILINKYFYIALQRNVPRFSGYSYLALPMITDSQITTLRLTFKPNYDNKYMLKKDQKESLILYSKFFILLLDEMGRIELRYLTEITPSNSNNNNNDYSDVLSTNKITRVIGSRDVVSNNWNELIITDASVDLISEKEQYFDEKKNSTIDIVNRIILVTPEKINTSSKQNSELFVGGLPRIKNNDPSTKKINYINYNNNKLFGMKSFDHGFNGCIREFSINDRIYNLKSDFNGDVLDGFDIGRFILLII